MKTQNYKGHFMKKMGVCGCLAILLTGCADYHLAKVKPNENKVVQISDNDSKMLLTQSINQVLATKSSLDNQLIIYLEDTVKLTAEMKVSLLDYILEIKENLDKNINTVTLLQLSEQSKTKQKKTIETFKDMSKCLDDMTSCLNENNFTQLKEEHNRYNSITKQLQSLSIV